MLLRVFEIAEKIERNGAKSYRRAAGVAGILKLARRNFFKQGDTVVCIITGHGLKDPETAISVSSTPATQPADAQAVADYLGLER